MKKYILLILFILISIIIKILAWKVLYYGFMNNIPKNEDYNIILYTQLHLISAKYLLQFIDFAFFLILFLFYWFINSSDKDLISNLKLSIGYIVISIFIIEYVFGFHFL